MASYKTLSVNVKPSIADRVDAVALKTGRLRSDVLREILAEGLDRYPLSDEDLARLRLTGGAARPNGESKPAPDSNVVPIAEGEPAIVMTRHTLSSTEKAGFEAAAESEDPDPGYPLLAA